MDLTKNDFEALYSLAVSAALEAGSIIRESAGKFQKVSTKNVGSSQASSVVTETDFLSQKIILNILEPSLKKYDLGLLTEEAADDSSRFNKDYFWCIDPLDGTLAYIEGKPGYAVSISLISKVGSPVIGVIYDPVADISYGAVKERGLFKNGEVWKPESNSPGVFTLFHDRSFLQHKDYNAILGTLNTLLENTPREEFTVISKRGAAMNAMGVLENIPGCYFKFPKKDDGGGSLWDFGASALFFKEAGCWISDISGKELDLNPQGTTFMNKTGVLFAPSKELALMVIEIYKELSNI